MRSIWLAGVATAASSTAAAAGGMSSAPVTAAAVAFVPRGLGIGGSLSLRARLLGGSRRSRSSPAPAAATTTSGFVIQAIRSTTGQTSTWAAGVRSRHVSTVGMTRRLRPAARSSISRGWVATTLGSKAAGAGGVGVGGGSSRSSRSSRSSPSSGPSQLLFSAEVEVCAATRPEQAVEGTNEAALSEVEAGGGEEEAGAGPLKVNLLEMSNKEVEDFLVGMGEPKFRAKQVLKWVFDGGAGSFDDMANIPKALRAKLAEVATVGVLEVAAKQVSKDGTKKLAYRLSDGQVIESVLMPYSDGRRTACISSQAGCAMGCVFCATGQMGFKRQLSAAEIFEQAYRFSQELQARGDRLSNVVFMGMGEPLANYKNVMEAVRRINTELGIGARHITISTVGLVPRILRLSQEDIQVKLAVSLHAANDRERSALLPVNRRFPLSELIEACREYVDVSGRRMTFEWALIQGENDSPEVASELGRLLRPLKGMCHVNIIPLNPTAGYKGGASMADAMNYFVEVLARNGVPATPRIRRGIDIDAGCGQLTVKVAQDEVLGKGL